MALPVQRASLAAQVAAQARPVSVTPIRPAQPLPPSTAPITLKDQFERFKTLVYQERKTAGELAFLAYRLAEANDWEAFGFPDVETFCDALGISEGWWKRAVSLGGRLQSLTFQEMQSMSHAVMDCLVRVHPSIWDEYAWVEEAKVLALRDLKSLVAQRNQGVVHLLTAEPRTELTVRFPMSQKPIVERRLETLRRQEKLGSVAEALTFALTSVDRAALMEETIKEVVEQVAELNRIHSTLRELPSEKEARLEDGADSAQTAARLRAARLTSQILRTLGDVNEVHEKEVSSASPGASVQTI